MYKHTTPNGKVYIGITSQKPEKRWANGHGYKGTYFGNAIKKYGWKNIKHEILFTELDELDAKEKEVELIEKFRSFEKDYGYNLTKGGDGTVGLKRSKEQIQLLKDLLSKKVYQRELDGTFIKEWNSIREVERITGFHRQCITTCCHKKVFQAYGYLWSFDKDYIAKKKKRKNCKTVYQYDLDGRLVKVWESLVEIEKTTKEEIDETVQTYPNLAEYAERYFNNIVTLKQQINTTKQKRKYIIIPYEETIKMAELTPEEKKSYSMKEIKRRAEGIVDGITSIGLVAKVLSTQDIIELLYSMYHRDDDSVIEELGAGGYFTEVVTKEGEDYEKPDELKQAIEILNEAENRFRFKILDHKLNSNAMDLFDAITQDINKMKRGLIDIEANGGYDSLKSLEDLFNEGEEVDIRKNLEIHDNNNEDIDISQIYKNYDNGGDK